MPIAKLFWDDHTQAIRLPQEIRFEGDAVRIRKQGQQVIIEPLVQDWGWLDTLGSADREWEDAVRELRRETSQQTGRNPFA